MAEVSGGELQSIFRTVGQCRALSLRLITTFSARLYAYSNFIVIELLCSVLEPDWRVHLWEET